MFEVAVRAATDEIADGASDVPRVCVLLSVEVLDFVLGVPAGGAKRSEATQVVRERLAARRANALAAL